MRCPSSIFMLERSSLDMRLVFHCWIESWWSFMTWSYSHSSCLKEIAWTWSACVPLEIWVLTWLHGMFRLHLWLLYLNEESWIWSACAPLWILSLEKSMVFAFSSSTFSLVRDILDMKCLCSIVNLSFEKFTVVPFSSSIFTLGRDSLVLKHSCSLVDLSLGKIMVVPFSSLIFMLEWIILHLKCLCSVESKSWYHFMGHSIFDLHTWKIRFGYEALVFHCGFESWWNFMSWSFLSSIVVLERRVLDLKCLCSITHLSFNVAHGLSIFDLHAYKRWLGNEMLMVPYRFEPWYSFMVISSSSIFILGRSVLDLIHSCIVVSLSLDVASWFSFHHPSSYLDKEPWTWNPLFLANESLDVAP